MLKDINMKTMRIFPDLRSGVHRRWKSVALTVVWLILIGATAWALSDSGTARNSAIVSENQSTEGQARPYGVPSRQLSHIEWPSRAERDTAARAQLSAGVLSQVDSVSLPVLLPRDAELLREIHVVHVLGPSTSSYSTSLLAPQLGISFSISGSRSFLSLPSSTVPFQGTMRDSVMGVPATVEHSDESGIWSVTWEQYGAAYLIMLDCDESKTTICANDSYVRFLADSMTFVGGSFATQDR